VAEVQERLAVWGATDGCDGCADEMPPEEERTTWNSHKRECLVPTDVHDRSVMALMLDHIKEQDQRIASLEARL